MIKCHYCDNEATVLCDERTGDRGNPYQTCDRPMCDDCKISDGSPTFYKYSTDNLRTWGEVDYTDYCPDCVSKMPTGKRIAWGIVGAKPRQRKPAFNPVTRKFDNPR